ncbi:MAG: hypothetical protein KGL74_13245, partial [Elusimicrobia bacterium]|nr:hypothetical protein [Elusimicrobiota bacterium]
MIAVTPLNLKALEASAADLAFFAFEDAGIVGAKALPAAVKTALAAKLKGESFKGGAKEIARVDMDIFGKVRRVFVAGLGQRKGAGPENFRRAAGNLLGAVRAKRETLAVLCSVNAAAVAEGLTLASYKYEEYKKGDEDKLTAVHLVIQDAASRVSVEKTCAKAALYAEAVFLSRDLVNRAPSDKAPQTLADLAETFKGTGVTVEVIDAAKAAELGMGALLGVGRGATQPPVMVHMIFKPKAKTKKRVALVGKGITFDSGGLSLKPAASMEDMKCDMAGAASVLAVFKVIA